MFIKPQRRRCVGFTLIEVLIALGLSGLVLAVITSFTLFSSRSFAAMTNYTELNRKSMHALDVVTREIRQAQEVTAITADSITVVDVDGKLLSIKYYDDDHSIYPKKVVMTSATSAEVLLEDCDSFAVSGFLRTPSTNSYAFFPTTNPKLIKMVQISWECYRDVFAGDKLTTESVQTAKIVLRYNPLKK